MNTQNRTYSQNPWGNWTSVEDIKNLILNHNKVVNTLKNLDFKIKPNQFLKGMTLWSDLAVEGSYIVSIARANGINIKVNMQDGKISHHDFCCFYEVYFENQTKMLIRSGNDKLDIKTAEAFLKEDIANCGKIVNILHITIANAKKLYSITGYNTWPLIG